MDTKWRNLGIVVAVIVIALIAYFALPSILTPAPYVDNTASLDEGYGKMLALFESNDVNFSEFRELKIVGSDLLGNVYLAMPESNLIKLKSDLVSFKSNPGPYNAESKAELSAAASVFILTIDNSLADYFDMTKISAYFSEVNSCDLANLDDSINIINKAYGRLEALANAVDEFARNYDEYAELVVVDLDSAYPSYISSLDSVLLKKTECGFE
ncbi:MAG: hypothetical protein AABW59_02375 [archaeon]